VPLPHQIAVPAQDGVRADEKPQSAKDLARQRCQEGCQEDAVLGGESHLRIGAELSLQDHDLVTQSENLDIFVPITHRQ
jgi:hypothetical protein